MLTSICYRLHLSWCKLWIRWDKWAFDPARLTIYYPWWDLSGSWALQKEHCTQTAATAHTSIIAYRSHSKFNTTKPIPPYSSNQWPALLTGDTAVCWVEGDRWETGMALSVCVPLCVCMCVCVCRRVGGGRTGEPVRLILSHTDNGMLSHTSDGLWERECAYVCRQESGCFRGWLTCGFTEGGLLKRQIVWTSMLYPLSPFSSCQPPLPKLQQWCAPFI